MFINPNGFTEILERNRVALCSRNFVGPDKYIKGLRRVILVGNDSPTLSMPLTLGMFNPGIVGNVIWLGLCLVNTVLDKLQTPVFEKLVMSQRPIPIVSWSDTRPGCTVWKSSCLVNCLSDSSGDGAAHGVAARLKLHRMCRWNRPSLYSNSSGDDAAHDAAHGAAHGAAYGAAARLKRYRMHCWNRPSLYSNSSGDDAAHGVAHGAAARLKRYRMHCWNSSSLDGNRQRNYLMYFKELGSSIQFILCEILLRTYSRFIIPVSYRDDALYDLRQSFREKSFGSALIDLWEYTLGAFEYLETEVQEVWLRGLFHLKRFLLKTRVSWKYFNQQM